MQYASFDAYSPREIAGRVEAAGLAKATTPLLSLVMLGILAGAFIGLGALFSMIVISDPGLGFAAQRVLGGAVFALGLVLVVVAGDVRRMDCPPRHLAAAAHPIPGRFNDPPNTWFDDERRMNLSDAHKLIAQRAFKQAKRRARPLILAGLAAPD